MWIPFCHLCPAGSERRATFVPPHFSNVWMWWEKTKPVLHNLLDSGSQRSECTVGWLLPAMLASVSTWNGEATEKCTPSTTPASVHTCTAISRLINCESRSLETLNHSFSVLSRAASLAALTRVPPYLPNTGDGGGRGGGHGGFTVCGVAT